MKSLGRYEITDTQIVDTTTGEILDRDDIKFAAEQKLLKQYKDTQRMLNDLGVNAKVRIIRDKDGIDYESINLKENHEFNKIFRVDVNFMFRNAKLSSESYAFIGRFSSSLHFPSNSVVLDGKQPTQLEMADEIGIGRTRISNALKELEFYDVIKRKKVNGETVVVFNPFLFSTGVVSIDTYRLFRDSIYNPVKGNPDVDESSKNKEGKRRKKTEMPTG